MEFSFVSKLHRALFFFIDYIYLFCIECTFVQYCVALIYKIANALAGRHHVDSLLCVVNAKQGWHSSNF